MEVNSAATATVSSTQNTQSVSANTKAENKTSTSFDEQMKNAQKEAQTSEKTEVKTEVSAEEKNKKTNNKEEEKVTEQNDLSKTTKNEKHKSLADINVLADKITENSDLSKIVEKEKYKSELNPVDLLSLNIQNLIETQNIISNKNEVFQFSIKTDTDLTKDISQILSYENIKMDDNDAKFFIDIVQNNEGGIQNIMAEIQQTVLTGEEGVQKSATVSKALLEALQNTVKTGQAVRVDFGHDVAVIMRVSKDGSIMANFIPGDKAVENYLKNNIDFLRQRFDEEDIPYSQLSYSQQQNRERRQQNKEDRNE